MDPKKCEGCLKIFENQNRLNNHLKFATSLLCQKIHHKQQQRELEEGYARAAERSQRRETIDLSDGVDENARSPGGSAELPPEFAYPELPPLVDSDSDEEMDDEDDGEGLEWQSDAEDEEFDVDFQALEEALFPLGPDWSPLAYHDSDHRHSDNVESTPSETEHQPDSKEDTYDDVAATEALKSTQERRVVVERPLIDDGHGLKPKCSIRYSQKHRKSRAGSVISESHNSDSRYASDVRDKGNAEQNPWAPFASQMDWDIARWAKLRGIGSTDLTELLAIEGVSFSVPNLIVYANPRS